MKISYIAGHGDRYPNQVHHRAASIPFGKWHSCAKGNQFLNTKGKKNPNLLVGAMVGEPDKKDIFLDERDEPMLTEPSISSNAYAGLVAALHNSPIESSYVYDYLGIDTLGNFQNVHIIVVIFNR